MKPVHTILVVDDVPDACDILARLLRHGGYRAVTAEDGASALTAVEVDGPDLVVLDVSMPEMDGLDVMRTLKADPRHRDLPVMMFTAVGDPDTVMAAKHLGAADYILKGSIGGSDLLARIARLLPPPC